MEYPVASPRSFRAYRAGLLLFVFIVASAAGAAPPPLGLTLERFVVEEQESDNEVVLLPSTQAEPGDLLLERLTATNETGEEVTGVGLILPIAAAASYVPGSVSIPVVEGSEVHPHFSYDGGLTFAPEPLTREIVRVVDGEEVREVVVVPPSEYTNVLWRLPLIREGETVVVSIRSVLE